MHFLRKIRIYWRIIWKNIKKFCFFNIWRGAWKNISKDFSCNKVQAGMGYSSNSLPRNGKSEDNQTTNTKKGFWVSWHERIIYNRFILHLNSWIGKSNYISRWDTWGRESSRKNIKMFVSNIWQYCGSRRRVKRSLTNISWWDTRLTHF